MVDLQVAADGERIGEGGFLHAGVMPAPAAIPAFSITADNTHPTAATNATYRPIDLKMPWPEEGEDYREQFSDAGVVAFDVTHGSQTGTAVLGEKVGRAYRRLHVRGISVPANTVLSQCAVTRNDAASPPTYALASDGFAQFTGSNAPWFHCGSSIMKTATWTQIEDGVGRHKWVAWIWDSTEGVMWLVRAYTWPNSNRLELIVTPIWHDQRTTTTHKLVPSLIVSMPTTHDMRAEFSAQHKRTTATGVFDSTPRTYIRLTDSAGLRFNDAQRLPCRLSVMLKSAPQAEQADWSASMSWPVKAVCDPAFWRNRIGPHSILSETTIGGEGFWNASPQWGDGGSILRNALWNHADPRYGFRARMTRHSSASQDFRTRPERTGYPKSNEAARTAGSYGNNFLTDVLGIRYGNPRMLHDFAFSALWDAMRPNSYVYWSAGAPQGRWITVNDYNLGIVPGSLLLKEQRIHSQVIKNYPDVETLGKSKSPATADERFERQRGIASLSAYKTSHQDSTLVGALALLDDIDDVWFDTLNVNAACYIYEVTKTLQDPDDNNPSNAISSPGEFRTGRSDMMLAWALEIVDPTTFTTLLVHIENRFERDRKPYREFWNHVKYKHGWQSWHQHYAQNQAPLLMQYKPIWEDSRGLPGYAALARYVRRYRSRGHICQKVARIGSFHIRFGWSKHQQNGERPWREVYGLHIPGLRLKDIDPNTGLQINNGNYADPENYGNAPDLTKYGDTTLVKMDDQTEDAWWLGCVQESTKFVESELDEAATVTQGNEIIDDLVARIKLHTSNIDSEREVAYQLDAEHHAAEALPEPPSSITLTVNVDGERTGEGANTLEQDDATNLSVAAEGTLSAGGSNTLRLGTAITIPVEGEFVEDDGQMLGITQSFSIAADGERTGEGSAHVIQGDRIDLFVTAEGEFTEGDGLVVARAYNLEIPAESEFTEGDGSKLGAIDLYIAVEGEFVEGAGVDVEPKGVSPTYHDYRGTWLPEIAVRGGWQIMTTDQGITITAGDAEVVRIEVFNEDGQKVDCTTASQAEFVLLIPKTPYQEEKVLLRRDITDGVDCSSGDVVVSLGDTSDLEAGHAVASVRVTLGTASQTVARMNVRILDNPVPSTELQGDSGEVIYVETNEGAVSVL